MASRYHKKSLEEHLDSTNSPKRILALDGGGVRGVLTLQYLARIEYLLRERHGGDPDFRLCHYFDLIAGTSTGAFIASHLAKGWSVAAVQSLYKKMAIAVFRRSLLRWGALRYKFDKTALEKLLKKNLGESTELGSPKIETGLMLMTKRFDTTSPWPMNNNPKGKYYNADPDEEHIANRHFPLWSVVRASTAAPSYFKPQFIVVAEPKGDEEKVPVVGHFVDGGVSIANNPALQALFTATLGGFKLGWPLGEENILLVSVGTGRRNPNRRMNWWAMFKSKIPGVHAINAVVSIMDDATAHVETTLQWLSSSRTAGEIDAEIGSLKYDLVTTPPSISYARYNVELSPEWMKENLDAEYSDKYLRGLENLGNADRVDDYVKLGGLAAEKQVHESDFPHVFDLA